MTTLLALVIVCATVLVVLVVLYGLMRRDVANGQLLQALREQHDANLQWAATLQRVARSYAEDLNTQSARRDDETRMVLTALTADRDRLLNAALARQDPQAARQVGLIDQAQAARRVASEREAFLADMTREGDFGQTQHRPVVDEYVSTDGQPMVPVGMD